MIYIIPKNTVVTPQIRSIAISLDCNEIAIGIPPRYSNIITDNMLPMVYKPPIVEEQPQPVQPPMSSHISILTAINPTEQRPARVRRTWNGEDYYYDCLVTQSARDEYASGKIQIGDYVIVHFDDNGEQIVTAKIFKSW